MTPAVPEGPRMKVSLMRDFIVKRTDFSDMHGRIAGPVSEHETHRFAPSAERADAHIPMSQMTPTCRRTWVA